MKSIMTRALAILAILLTLASVSFAAAPPKKDAAQAPTPDYVIGAEDVLDISVWKNVDLSRVVTVRPDGMISLPLIGDIKASGITPEQLKASIEKKLKEYSETAIVSVIVQAVNSYKVFVLGEVRTPGVQVYRANATVLQAISQAGGFSQFSSKNKIIVIRKRADGSDEKLVFRFNDLVSPNEGSVNPILKPGDTVFVQ